MTAARVTCNGQPRSNGNTDASAESVSAPMRTRGSDGWKEDGLVDAVSSRISSFSSISCGDALDLFLRWYCRSSRESSRLTREACRKSISQALRKITDGKSGCHASSGRKWNKDFIPAAVIQRASRSGPQQQQQRTQRTASQSASDAVSPTSTPMHVTSSAPLAIAPALPCSPTVRP